MPPKPWETKNRAPSTNISQIIASSPTQKDDVVKQPPSGIASTQGGLSNAGSLNIANSTMSPGLSSMNSMGSYGGYGSSYGGYGSSYGGGYGSSYGGMGGYGGGYGSSYGGMGGYGSYGSSYGMGMGMGRYGMNGMNGQDQQNSFLNHTLMTLERFGYLINILCEIARSFDANYEGLHLFGNSFKSIGHKTSSGTSNGIKWLFNKIFSLLKIIFQFIKHNVFFMQNERSQEKYKSVSRTLSILVIVFSISLYPLIRKGLKAV